MGKAGSAGRLVLRFVLLIATVVAEECSCDALEKEVRALRGEMDEMQARKVYWCPVCQPE